MTESPSAAIGVYVHIPFCVQRCYYCAFAVTLDSEPAWSPYVQRVKREIEMSAVGLPETVYFGGGTPSLVHADHIALLLQAIGGAPREVTIEANPETISAGKIERYREIGVTRISLGAQSLEDEDLKRAGRLHTAEGVFRDFEALRRGGFENISLDLIAGLPGQRFETWSKNLDSAVRLRPEHISIYMLDSEERSAWGKHPPPAGTADEDFARAYLAAAERLAAAGYLHYEISNWALPGRESRHNRNYWTGAPYRGFGLSAHSYAPYTRSWNTASMAEYAARIDAGAPPVEGHEVLSLEMRWEETFMLGLRQMAGFNPRSAAEELGVRLTPEWYARVRDLEDAGWLEYDGTILKLKPAGWLTATSVTAELLWPTPSSIFEATP